METGIERPVVYNRRRSLAALMAKHSISTIRPTGQLGRSAAAIEAIACHCVRLFSLVVLACGVVFLVSGCDQSSRPPGQAEMSTADKPSPAKLANPVGSLKLALRGQRWDEAWSAAEVVLKESESKGSGGAEGGARPYQDIKPETLALVAQAAHQVGRTEQSAEYLRLACMNESFANPMRVRQSVIAMIGIGQFYDSFDFLEEALAAQPKQHETRRWLFDFYIGADDRVSAVEHGQRLVLERQFDLTLLKDLSNTERRTLDADPLDQMVSRNPDDKRPLLGTAKTKFDEAKFDEAVEILSEIVAAHPEHHPSQAVLGQALAAGRRFDELEDWAASQTDGVQDYPGYWIALGDWARSKDDFASALRCFAQAANCGDPEVVQIWTRLATLLAGYAETDPEMAEQLQRVVNERAQQLSRFHQLKDRFNRTGEISRAIALDIAQTLVKLGRLWEAEAWSAIVTTLPEDDSVDVDQFREDLLKRLKPDSAWRVREALPDFDPLIASLPLPPIERIVSATESRRPMDASADKVGTSDQPSGGDVVDWKLEDEAAARGLAFWGRTGEMLDQPGIMLYQTLGCGGGTIDFDLDGWSDLYLVAAGGRPPNQDSAANALFRNLDGQFQSVENETGTADEGFGQGVSVGDVNEDGFPDLLVLNYGRNRLYVNNGDGTFRDASDQMPAAADDEWSSSGAIADLDGDGLSDIVVVNYCATLGPVTRPCPMKDSDVIRSCSPMLFAAMPDRFIRSNGDGSFSDATESWDAMTDSPGRGLGIVVGDLDGKRGNEIFIANDMTNNHYWSQPPTQPDGAGQGIRFSESAMLRGIGADDRGIPQGSMGIATGDLDRDGDMDFYVTNFDNEYNTLHSQSSSGTWQDKTQGIRSGRGDAPACRVWYRGDRYQQRWSIGAGGHQRTR